MKSKKTKMASKPVPRFEPIGIPMHCTAVGSSVFLKLDELLRLRGEIAALSKAMTKIGFELAPPTHVAEGRLFVPAHALPGGDSGSDDGESMQRVDLKTRILSLATPSVTRVLTVSSPAIAPPKACAPEPALGAEARGKLERIPVDLIRQGPATLEIAGQTIPYASACPPPDPDVKPSPAPAKVWIDRVGKEVHLLDSQRHRMRSDEPHQLEGIRPGTLVAAENCRVEQALIAGPEAFRVQRGFDFNEGD